MLYRNTTVTWNYRIIRHEDDTIFSKENNFWYAIHEVYYENGVATGWTDPIQIYADSVVEMNATLQMILDATKEPVLYIDGNTLKEYRE